MAAPSVTVRIMEDGPRNCVLQVEGYNGGSGGSNLPYTVLVALSSLGYVNDERKQRATGLRIDKIRWDLNTEVTLQVMLYWDTTTPPTPGTTNPALVAIGTKTDNFHDFGGLYAPPGLSGATGTIGIAALGATTTVPQSFMMIIYLTKLLSTP